MKKLKFAFISLIMAFLLCSADIEAAEIAAVQVDAIMAADANEMEKKAIITDQTGEYVSIYIQGENLDKDTVKPVFYDSDGNVISGDVKASEKMKEGTFFRIEKLESDAWDLKTSEEGKKSYLVDVEAVGDVEVSDTRSDKQVEIKRRDLYYHCQNNINCTITIHLADDLNISENAVPVLRFVDKEIAEDIKEVTGEMVKEVNVLTGAEETKALFTFTRTALANLRDTYSYAYTLAVSDENGNIMEFPNRLGDLFEYQGESIEKFQSGRTNIFYLPYWVGGVYQIDSISEQEFYYITEEDVEVLGEVMYSCDSNPYGAYDLDNTDYSSGSGFRQNYAFYQAADLPDKPVGKPGNVSVEKVDKDHVVLTWTGVEGATEYGIYVQKPGEENTNWIDTTEELSYICDISNFDYLYGKVKGDFLFSIRPIARDGDYTVFGDFSEQVLYTVLPQIEGVEVKEYSANYDGKSHTITVSGLPDDAQITYATSEAGEYTTTKPIRTKVGVTQVYYKVEMEGYDTLTGMVKIVIRPKATTKVTTNLYKYNAVKVSWKKVDGATGYAVYYKKASEDSYKLLKRTTNLYVKTATLSAGTKYTFKVVSYVKVDGIRYVSKSIKTSSIYTLKKLAAPTVSRKTSSKVRVKWKDINGERGYQISRSTSSSGTNIVATFKTPENIYKDVSATKGKTYYYKVRAYVIVDGEKVYGPWSNTKKYKIT